MTKTIWLTAALLGGAMSLLVWGQTTAPTRPPEAITGDLQVATGQLQQAIDGGQALQSAGARKKAAPQALPVLNSILGLIDELEAAQPQGKAELDATKMQFYVLAAILDDPAQTAALTKTAAATDLDAARAKAELAIANYVKAADDAARNKALDEYDVALKAAPGDDPTLNLITMTALNPTPTIDVYQHMLKIVKDDGQGQAAQELATMMAGDVQQMQMVGKPLAIEGVTLDGQKFSTATWKGKVVLADFWATWCGPCLAELPNVKRAYVKYHAQGLEIVGISCDNDGGDLRKFLQQNPDMPWPELFDDKTAGWNPIATAFGIQSIPTMYLIDRKGILRTVDARGQLDEMIPKLLAEKP